MSREPQDDIAWGNFLTQHRNARNMENFVRPFFRPMTKIAKSFDDLLSVTNIDQSTGSRLDYIGSIVGVSRFVEAGITLAFFGFSSQPSGRGFGLARMRHEKEPITASYNAPDTEFRTLIRAKIALNNGHGTAEEIAEAAKMAFRAPVVSARDKGPGHIELWVGRIPSPDEGLGRVIPEFLPRAAGVRISIVFWAPSLPFGFIENSHFGFGVGVLARTPIS